MAKLDSASLPYGMLQYYQVHYIMKSDSKENDHFLSRCEPVTTGHFDNKRVIDVKWTGAEKFVQVLQTDVKLTEMLRQFMLLEGEIKIDPLEDHIRIYGKWIHEDAFAFNQIMFEIANKIAGHIKTRLRSLGEMT